jgi:hypothetical protein
MDNVSFYVDLIIVESLWREATDDFRTGFLEALRFYDAIY